MMENGIPLFFIGITIRFNTVVHKQIIIRCRVFIAASQDLSVEDSASLQVELD